MTGRRRCGPSTKLLPRRPDRVVVLTEIDRLTIARKVSAWRPAAGTGVGAPQVCPPAEPTRDARCQTARRPGRFVEAEDDGTGGHTCNVVLSPTSQLHPAADPCNR